MVIYPFDCIVLPFCCHGLGSVSKPQYDMANAWKNAGADAFVGCTRGAVTGTHVECSEAFWEKLSIDDDNVLEATKALCSKEGCCKLLVPLKTPECRPTVSTNVVDPSSS